MKIIGGRSIPVSKISNQKGLKAYLSQASSDVKDNPTLLKMFQNEEKLIKDFRRARKAMSGDKSVKQVVLGRKGTKLYLFFSPAIVTDRINPQRGTLFRCDKTTAPQKLNKPLQTSGALPPKFRKELLKKMGKVRRVLLALGSEMGDPVSEEGARRIGAQLRTQRRLIQQYRKLYTKRKVSPDTEVEQKLGTLREMWSSTNSRHESLDVLETDEMDDVADERLATQGEERQRYDQNLDLLRRLREGEISRGELQEQMVIGRQDSSASDESDWEDDEDEEDAISELRSIGESLLGVSERIEERDMNNPRERRKVTDRLDNLARGLRSAQELETENEELIDLRDQIALQFAEVRQLLETHTD